MTVGALGSGQFKMKLPLIGTEEAEPVGSVGVVTEIVLVLAGSFKTWTDA